MTQRTGSPWPWTAWVPGADGQHEIDEALQSLVGQHIRAARYIEIDYEGGAQGWQRPTFDELDYGLELDLDEIGTLSVVWEQHDLNEGLNIRPGNLIPDSVRAEGSATRDVSQRWAALGPQEIAAVETAWDRNSVGPAYDRSGRQVDAAPESDLCLRTVAIRGAEGRRAIIALWGADMVQVYFSMAAASEANVLLP